MKLQVYLPYSKKFITQRFGENANGSYARDGLKGHTAYDWGVAYGTPIPNCVANAYCYSLLNKDSADPSKYRAVCTLVETNDGVFEVSYGHCSKILAEVGKTYQVGEILANIGNTGDVFTDHEITKAERLKGSKAGAHLHGPQIRAVKKVKKQTAGKQYLSDAFGIYKKDGFYYEISTYTNGYNGCINPYLPWSTETLASSYKAPIVVEIVKNTSTALETIKTLPEAEQGPFLERIKEILLALFPFLKE